MKSRNLKKELEQIVPQNTLNALFLCSEAAEKLSLKIFLIGGVVRDIIIGKDNFDIDITVQGNAVNFAFFLEKIYPDTCKIKEIHDKFKTAKVVFSPTLCPTPIEIDLASTRKESYPYPSSLPMVEEIGCELYEDVKRRDFTINSMALSLNKDNFGDLIDYLGGYEDINNKIIRILHTESFKDDPTRIIRALKFRVRFGYNLDETTKQLQEKILESGIFDNLCGERIKSELKQTFNLSNPECMEIFLRENIYRLVDKDIEIPENFEVLYKNCESIISKYSEYINSDLIWLIYFGLLLTGFSKDRISEIAGNLYLSGTETSVLTGAKIILEKEDYLKNKLSNFEIYEFFEEFSNEAIIILLIKRPDLKETIDFYLKTLKNIKIYTTGQTLIDLGLEPGVIFGEILRKLLIAKINGEFSSEEEEMRFLKALISLY